MLSINSIQNTYNKAKYISFEQSNVQNTLNNANCSLGVMALDKNPSNRVKFENNYNDTKKADLVQSNPLKAIGYNIAKAYNILCTPKSSTPQTVSRKEVYTPLYLLV